MTKRYSDRGVRATTVSRRSLLRAAGLIAPAAALLPKVLVRTAAAATASTATFDFYISPSGSDSNSGTQASPWAITSLNTKQSVYAGKTIGLLAGTYDVSGMTPLTGGYQPVLQLVGGTSGSPTVLQAVTPRAAIIKANNGSTYPFIDCPIIGDYGASSKGYITIDGILFTGAGAKTIYLGDYGLASTGARWAGYVVQNCEITGMNCTGAAYGGNFSCIELAGGSGAYIGNNHLHDNIGQAGPNNPDHYSATLQWYCDSSVYEYNTLKNSGGFYGKESGQHDTQIRFNYVDNTNWGVCSAVQDFAADASVTSGTFRVHHNVLISSQNDLRPTLGGYATQPMQFYNNTIVCLNSAASQGMITRIAPGMVQFYNNLIVNDASGDHALACVNVGAPGLVDYNWYYSTTDYTFNVFSNDTSTTRESLPYSSWQSTLGSGTDAHSVMGTAPAFVGTGTDADYYKIQAGFSALTAGSNNSGVGAWGNSPPSVIGCNFVVPLPDPPGSLSVS